MPHQTTPSSGSTAAPHPVHGRRVWLGIPSPKKWFLWLVGVIALGFILRVTIAALLPLSPEQKAAEEKLRKEREAAARLNPAPPRSTADPGAPAPSRDIVRTLDLKPNEWSPWVGYPDGSRGALFDWETSDGRLETEYRFADGSTDTVTFERGKIVDLATRPTFKMNLRNEFRFRHPKKGTVTVTIRL